MANNHRTRKTSGAVACLGLILLSPHALLFAENNARSYEAARQRAIEATNIFNSGPLQIHATFHIQTLAGQIEGTYQYTQLCKAQVRVEVQNPGFSESIVEKGAEQCIARSRDLESLPIWYVRQLVRIAHSVPTDSFASKVTTTQNGRTAKCFTQERKPDSGFEYYGSQTCFDVESGALESMQWSFNTDLDRLEYSDFRKDDSKVVRATMRRLRNGKLLVDVQIDSFTHVPTNLDFFEPPANATKQESCKRFEPADAEYSEEYFRIRSAYKSGSVVIGGPARPRWRWQGAKVGDSGIRRFKDGRVALKALREVRVHPAKCDGKRVPPAFRLQVWFSPAMHPDSFQSFR